MSLYGMMQTGASGMNAQANRWSTVADNIANSSTTWLQACHHRLLIAYLAQQRRLLQFRCGQTSVRYSITDAGPLEFTTSNTDLAIDGDGFFIVNDSKGSPFLTRAGSFVKDGDGNLVNAAGFTLMGYDYTGGTPAPVVNGFDGLVPVNVESAGLTATPSTTGLFYANLDDSAAVVAAANLPSANAATAEYSHKSSLVVYDTVGKEVLLDFYYTKTANDTWEVAVFDRSRATPTTGFPYGAAALSPPRP
jgi:flagellar hook protein FlgE